MPANSTVFEDDEQVERSSRICWWECFYHVKIDGEDAGI